MKTGLRKKITYIFCLFFLCISLCGCQDYVLEDFANGNYKKGFIELIEGRPWESAEDRLERDRKEKQDRLSIDNGPKMILDKDKESKSNDEPVVVEEPKEEIAEDDEELNKLVGGSKYTRGQLNDKRREIEAENSYNFYYSKLSDSDKDLYAQLYLIVDAELVDEKLITLNVDKVDQVFFALTNDHPQMYYVAGYSVKKYTVGKSVTGLEFSGEYLKSIEERKPFDLDIEQYAKKCLIGIPQEDDYLKIKHIYDYIIKNTEYDLSSPENQNILSVFLNGRSVCQGYAKAMQYMLDQVGIPCILVSGTVKSGESHAWNIVKSNGKWYYLDCTWGDASFQGDLEMIPDICYDYLCANSELMNKTHRIITKYTLPECTALDDFYYVREETYFPYKDLDKLRHLVVEHSNKGEEYLTIKCANREVYEEMQDDLFKKNRISDIITDLDEIKYAKLDDSYTLMFKIK